MIDIRNVTKTFGGFVALHDVSLNVAAGELVALLGPSGSGKTTLLRIIAGLEQPSNGQILFDGQDATGLAVRDRGVGFVFQHYALFRHMTVFDNIAFGMTIKKRSERPDRAAIKARVEELLHLVQLDGLGHRYPPQLSGGQRQRVALARALAVNPKVLLLDEPFGALDARVRKDLRRWLRRLHDELHITGLFVTHDQEEAIEVADRIVVMNQGCIEQVGSPADIYDHPASPFAFQFLGNGNSLPCRVRDGQLLIGSMAMASQNGTGRDSEGTAFVRPHDLALGRPLPGQPGDAVIRHIAVLGPVVRIELGMDSGTVVEAELTRQQFAEIGFRTGEQVLIAPRRARLFLHDGWNGTVLGLERLATNDAWSI